jgi:hypothetical protein
MATYPDDIIFNTASYTVVGSTTTYNNTGSTTEFNTTSTASHKGEVLATVDGVAQETSLYSLANAGNSISFAIAPVATTLTLKNLTIPSSLTRASEPLPVLVSEFSNGAVTTISGNNYVVNGTQVAWPLAVGSSASSTDSLMVMVDGVLQLSSSYTYPSTTLGTQGIDISPALPDFSVLQIRAFSTTGTVTTLQDRCRGLVDKKPAKGFSQELKFNTAKFKSQVGYEKRRIISRKPERSWSLSYIAASGIVKDSLDDFYKARFGEYESFLFSLSHLNEGIETPTVRFDGPIQSSHNWSKGTAPTDNYYTIQVKLKEVFD